MSRRFWQSIVLLRHLHWPMLFATAALLAMGVAFVYSSCFISPDRAVRPLYEKQIQWIVAGAIGYLFFAAWDYRELGKYSWWAYGGALVLLVRVLLFGVLIHGARRRLDMVVTVQPSEVAKLAVIVLLARILSAPGINFARWRVLAPLLVLVAVPVLLIMKQPDLGTALVFGPMVFVMLVVSGMKLRPLIVMAVTGMLIVGVIASAAFVPERMKLPEEEKLRIWEYTGLREHQRDRIITFFDADKDPLGRGWNRRQSMIAVGSGGFLGKGFRNGTQNILGFLPRSVAPTDFIFSVIAEEMGFLGSFVVLLLFGLVVTFGSLTACIARDMFGRLLCAGIVALIFSHVFVNIAMTVGLMPITGLPVPLLSYGGSIMIVTMSALGIVQSVHIRSHLRRQGM